jgi:uncharacterized Zn finger protein
MSDYAFPRTVAELARGNRRVVVRCTPCARSREVAPDVLEMAFGPDFDVYAGYRELELQLRCEQCGLDRRVIDIVDHTNRPPGAVSYAESVSHQLEMNALVRAQGRERDSFRTVRRRRR